MRNRGVFQFLNLSSLNFALISISMLRNIRKTARVALVSIFLVVLAGSVVRMTGSGMGCPDWPKCFGYIIPPTDEATVMWQADGEYHRGEMIVHNEELLIANSDFNSGDSFNSNQWNRYEKHDYAVFNVAHTWTEYINRLLGAFSGLPVLLLFILCIRQFRKDPLLTFLSLGILLMLGFEAWLGKVVVDSNLAEYKISLHMGGALLIVALILVLLRRAYAGGDAIQVKGGYRFLLFAIIILGLIQVGLGTQVRESIDAIAKDGLLERHSWIDSLGRNFIIHRSYAWIVVIAVATAICLKRKEKYPLKSVQTLGVIVLAEIGVGVVLSYAGMPAIMQPVHLLLGFLMFAFALQALLRTVSIHKLQG